MAQGDGTGVAMATGCANGTHGVGGFAQSKRADVVGVGKSGFVAGNGAHAHALVDAEAARFNNALFQAPAFAAGVLEIQVGVVHLVAQHAAQGGVDHAFVHTVGCQQQLLGNGYLAHVLFFQENTR